MRCPILNQCERRAHTLAIANQMPIERSAKLADLREPIIQSVGEGAYQVGGTNNFCFGGQCPEVNLFDDLMAVGAFREKPTTKGDYDKYRTPQFMILETGHYSCCAEFNTVSAEPKQTVKTPKVQTSWIQDNYQWIVGTLVAVAGTIAAFLSLK